MTGRTGKSSIYTGGAPSIPTIEVSDAAAPRELRRALRDPDVLGVVLTGQCPPRRAVPTTEAWDKPVVYVLSGDVSAATLALACRCHARVATERATVPTADLAAAGLLPTLTDLVGPTRMPELLVTDELTADRLRGLGIVSDVAGSMTAVADATRLARRLAELDPDALAALRDRRLPEPAPGAIPLEDAPSTGVQTVPPDPIPEAPDLRVVPGARSGTQTRQKILDAAARVIRTQGYTACRLADIAKLCGTHQTSVYHYFPSKEALVDEVLGVGVTRTFDTVRDEVESLPAGATALDRLAAAVRAHLRVVLASGDYAYAAMSITGELPRESYERIRNIQHRYGQYWSGLFLEAHDAGYLRPGTQLSVVRAFVAGALNYAVQWYDPAKGGVDALADEFLAMVLSGLARTEVVAGLDPARIGRGALNDQPGREQTGEGRP
jgi:AcrR family transcriptional regulator